jgi:hypothetical protein
MVTSVRARRLVGITSKTFSWLGTASTVVDLTGVWAEKDFDARTEIHFLVDQALRNHGLTISQGEPDLLVDLSILAEVNDVEEKVEDERAKRRDAVPFDPVGEGALIVELIDAETAKTVWIGGAPRVTSATAARPTKPSSA